jgi:hypothetical protein
MTTTGPLAAPIRLVLAGKHLTALQDFLRPPLGNKIVSLRSGITMAIRVGVSLGVGSNDAIVILDNDCGGIPCGIIDKTNLCKGTI